jgi:hypothetical protein
MPVYDPMQYWNSREHPNTQVDPDINPVEASFLSPLLKGANSVLEIGPGVGRLFPVYKNVPRFATVDLSQNYRERAEKRASILNLSVESHYIDSALAPFPFKDDEFDVGVVAFVFIHVPFENIVHSLREAARCCKKVAVVSARHRDWPKIGAKFDPSWHCFDHDYESLCKNAGLLYYGYQKFSETPEVTGFGFVFGRRR